MKKTISLALALTLGLGLAACGSPAPGSSSVSVKSTGSAATETSAAALSADASTASVSEASSADSTAVTDEKSVDTAATPAPGAHEIELKTFPLYVDKKISGVQIPLYFLDGVADLPYLEANDWLVLMDSTLGSGNGEKQYTMSASGPVVTYIRGNEEEGTDENSPTAEFDFENDTIVFSEFNLFCQKVDSSTILDWSFIPGFNNAGEPEILQKVETTSLDRYGDVLEIRLGDYDIDLVYQDGLYLVPLQTLSDLLLAPACGMCLFFNGQAVIITDMITKDNELYYSAPTGERSEALTEYGYNELCLMLDQLYGLKEIHDIESFDRLFRNVAFEDLIKGPSVVEADKAIFRFLKDYLDDGHSTLNGYSYLTGKDDYVAPDGTSEQRYLKIREVYSAAREKYYPDSIPGYQEVGNTAYVTFDTFEITVPSTKLDLYYSVKDLNELPENDTIALIMKAHEQITRENSPIENVVIDLSQNTGGAVDVACFVIAWFLGEASIGMKYTMTGAMCSTVYRADVNRDRTFDEKDTVSDKNLFCIISPLSFSCGNLVPCIFKESSLVSLLGRTSGGGSCSVQNISTAWGTSFRISGPYRLSFLKNGAFYDIDRGADPDFPIADPENLYDRTALTEYINSLL